jgi:hypothetical protein
MGERKPKRLTCWQCGSYDREARRCRLGKANPKKKHESITLAELLGPQALCMHNPFREPLLLRMHQPDRRFIFAAPETLSSQARPEVEVLED